MIIRRKLYKMAILEDCEDEHEERIDDVLDDDDTFSSSVGVRKLFLFSLEFSC